jgi:omega-6 fatty acid desaturase (delta-12 desaturase)
MKGLRAPDADKVRHVNSMVRPYWGAETGRSVRQLAMSAIPFAALWAAMLWSLDVHYGLTLVLAFPTAGFLMRLFMIQHDCGHGSFFRSRTARDVVGFCIGVIMLTPYQYWRRTHAYHHAHSGDLDLRGFGDIDTFTVQEYRAMSPLRRLAYRLYRHPILLFAVGPSFHFLVKHRFPWDVPRRWTHAWRSVWWTNLALVGLLVAAHLTIGLKAFFLVQAPVFLIATSVGVWLFYVQHQFEATYWQWHEDWDFFDAALFGSSHLVLPKPLQWITANIGIHHVHHLSSRIPNYRLQECLDANPELQVATQVSLRDAWRLTRLALWDEDRRQLVGFRELRRGRLAA